jgi:DMSO/TMAO reductase YedYZ molybdopterin-dependent catalytic subunit/cytochrome c5
MWMTVIKGLIMSNSTNTMVDEQSTSRRKFLKSLSIASTVVVMNACQDRMQSNQSVQKKSTLSKASVIHLPDDIHASHFHIHTLSPLALETRRSELHSSMITPVSRLFVRNNLPMPSPSILNHRDTWKVSIHTSQHRHEISLAELKNFGTDTVTSVLQCSGNGRKFFNHNPSGSPWAVGAAGCVHWSGVLLSKVLKFFSLSTEGIKYITATGGEELPAGIDPLSVMVERSIPIEKAMHDVLLAWELNGEPIPLTHGGPLRMVVPGYFGCNQIKYVKKLTLSVQQSKANIQQKGYRLRPVGMKGNLTQPSMWRMPVKSWINGPGADQEIVRAGLISFHGVAFSGERGIKQVEVSFDEGKSWEMADFYGPDMGVNAWRTFQISKKLVPGRYRIVSRATDQNGDRQPQFLSSNERGYHYNAWSEAGLDIKVLSEISLQNYPTNQGKTELNTSPINAKSYQSNLETDQKENTSKELSTQAQRGKKVFENTHPTCATCHTLADAEAKGVVGPNFDTLQPNLDQVKKAVTHGVGAMPSFAHSLSKDQIADLAHYIVETSQ